MKLLYAFNREMKDSLSKFNKRDIDIYKQVFKFEQDGWLVDRTNTIEFPLARLLNEQFALPASHAASTFDDACISRACELLDANKKIYIMWSGGIDSTAIVTAFLASGQDLSNIVIALNHDSIKEYPKFYFEHIRPKFPVIAIEELMTIASTIGIEGIVLSGEHADQLIGGSNMASAVVQNLGADFLAKQLTRENFKILMSSKRVDDWAIDCWFDMYTATFAKSPRELQTMYDLIWWHGFNFRWQPIGMKLFTRMNKGTDLRTFYSSIKFQTWAINHVPDLSMINTLKSETKDFILSYTKDIEYAHNKIKHPSSTLYFGKPSAAAVDQNFDKISHLDFYLPDFYVLDNSITKWMST